MLKLIVVGLLVVPNSLGVKITYPEVRRDAFVVDEYLSGSVKVSDPYRWLEDPDSEETKKFVETQNILTDEYLSNGVSDEAAKYQSVRGDIPKALIEAYSFPRFTLPQRKGSRYVYSMNTGLQNQNVLYIQDSLEGKPRVLVDPNALSEEGTIALVRQEFSADGELLAYGLSSKGSDWFSIKIRNVSSGNDFPEVLRNIKFTDIKWLRLNGNEGFFYATYPTNKAEAEDGTATGMLLNHKIYYHRVGTSQTEDIVVVEFPNRPKRLTGKSFTISGNKKYFFIFPTEGASGTNSFYYARLEGLLKKLELVPVIETFDYSYEHISNDDSIVYLKTSKGAPNYKIVAVDLNQPQEIYWTTIVPENPTRVLISATVVNEDKLLLKYLEDVQSKLEVRFLGNGSFVQEIPVQIGNIDEISVDGDKFFFNLVSFLTPGLAFRVDLKKQPYEAKLYRETKAPGFDASKFVTKQVFYSSKDGTKVPMFIVHKKDYVPQSNSPTYLFGYGGYSLVSSPDFAPSRTVFLQNFDGVYAHANIRGGIEYGTKWHEGGQGLNKQNVFDDFQAAAQHLYNEKYTNPSKLFIRGVSNGGLLVAACVNQRPELFGAAVAEVGVHDFLRFQKFTIGHAWCREFGCSDNGNATVFENLKKLSPYHNVRVPQDPKVQYPSVLLTTADHDDRVVPLHSYKMAAELQFVIGRSKRQTNPLLLKTLMNSGHGEGKPTSTQIKEFADMYIFLVRALGFSFNASVTS